MQQEIQLLTTIALNSYLYILLTKITAAQNEVALSYHRVRGLYFLAVVFSATIAQFNFQFYKNLLCYNVS